jgi:LacI family transcriptional regulator
VKPYLIVMTEHNHGQDSLWVQVQTGFEDRIAQLGGHTLVLTPAEARAHRENDDLPPLSGVFEFEQMRAARIFDLPGVPSVCFGDGAGHADSSDHINFDDVGGGAMATRFLWQNGHRRIAFLGLHGTGEAGMCPWSLRRETGWRQAMEQAGEITKGLAFHPARPSGLAQDEQIATGRAMAQTIIGRKDISAAIVANSLTLKGVLEAFQASSWPARDWPALLCFDAPGTGNTFVTHLRLPWEDIGREAAQVLWERHTGRLMGEPVRRLTPMRLVPRLSCRPDWAVASGLVLRQVGG